MTQNITLTITERSASTLWSASVGPRLLDTTAKLIIKKFFEKFSEAAQA
jgi:carbon monoxide dehydrogenase subunit G